MLTAVEYAVWLLSLCAWLWFFIVIVALSGMLVLELARRFGRTLKRVIRGILRLRPGRADARFCRDVGIKA